MAEKKGCWKTGCIGCVGLVLLMVGIPLILMVIGLAIGRPEASPGSERLSTELPALSTSPSAPASDEAGTSPEGVALDAGERPLMPDSLQVASATPPAGTIELDVELCRLSIEPGPPGSELRVEADFDTASFELEEEYTPQADGTWNYRLRFRDKLGWLRRMGGSNLSNERVRLIVPRGRPFALTGSMGTGESHMELGGLWLTSVDVEVGVGEHKMLFSEPTTRPIDFLHVDASVGQLQVLHAGNASPTTVRMDHSVGEARLDLTGAWQQDAEVSMDCSVGDCRMIVPSTVFVEVEKAGLTIGESRFPGLNQDTMPAEGAPTLTLRLTSSIGELRIQRQREEDPETPAPESIEPIEAPATPAEAESSRP